MREMVKTFLKHPEPPVWTPPDSFAEQPEISHRHQIPSHRDGYPSLLFHDLDVCDGKEIKMTFGSGAHQFVVINRALKFEHLST